MRTVQAINREEVQPAQVWFCTLTYPGVWDPNPAKWTRDFVTLRKRWERKWGKWPVIWKREFQRRGAPHFHLLVLLPAKVNKWDFRAWIAEAWYEVVGSGDAGHRLAGTQVDEARTWRGVAAYVSGYLAKTDQSECPVDPETGELVPVGRWWGIWNGELLPIELEGMALTREQAIRVRRVLLRYLGRRGRGALQTITCFLLSSTAIRLFIWAVEAST